MPATLTVNEPIHIMGPDGEILGTLVPAEDGVDIDLDFEAVKVGATRKRGRIGPYTAITFRYKGQRHKVPFRGYKT